MTIYMKHPELGNAHFTDEEQEQLEAAGWVRWPRSKEAKAGLITPNRNLPAIDFEAEEEERAPLKRKPGRPRKDAE